MKKYRVEYVKGEIKEIAPTNMEIPANETFLEEKAGDTIWAIFHAENDEKAQLKAKELAEALKTGKLPHPREKSH
jgi:hypothetical protein